MHQIKPIMRVCLVLNLHCCSSIISSICRWLSSPQYIPSTLQRCRIGKPWSSPWHWRTRWGDGHTLPWFPTGPSAPHQNLDQPNTGQGCYGASLSFRRESGKRRLWRQSDNHKGGQNARKEIDVPVTVARDTSKYIEVSTSGDTKVVSITNQPCRVAGRQASGSREETVSGQLCLSQWDDAKATEESP